MLVSRVLARRGLFSLARAATVATPARVTVSPQTFVARALSTSNVVLAKKGKEKVEKEEEDEADDGLPKDYANRVIKIGSRRLDTFVARTGGVPSSQSEKLILSGKVRVNEEKTTKKAYNLQVDDVVDIWQEVCPDNANLAYATRAEVRKYEMTHVGYDIHIRLWRKMLVDNWR